MKIRPVLADTGRPGGVGIVPGITAGTVISLLNAGWTFTTGLPLPEGGFILPGQALAVFVEAPWDELNRPHSVSIELVDTDGKLAQLNDSSGIRSAQIKVELVVPSVPMAPNGTPGMANLLIDLPAGVLRVPTARQRYVWRVTVGEEKEEIGFWVNAPMTPPIVGTAPPQPLEG